MRRALRGDAVAYMDRLRSLTAAIGTPWDRHPLFHGSLELAEAGFDFPERYGRMT